MNLPFWLCLPLLRLARVAHRPQPPLTQRGEPSSCAAAPKGAPSQAAGSKSKSLKRRRGWSSASGGRPRLRRRARWRPHCCASSPGAPRVTFDLCKLAFISDLAMGVLASYRRAAVRAGAWVCLAPSTGPN
jgi:hypothetical protein